MHNTRLAISLGSLCSLRCDTSIAEGPPVTLFSQIMLGTCLLTACALLHVLIEVGSLPYVSRLGQL